MAPSHFTRERVEEVLNKLHKLRTEVVKLDTQVQQINQRAKLLDLDIKRSEAAKILEVAQAKDSNGKPIANDTEVKRALVEDMLSRDRTFLNLLHKRDLLVKQYNRKEFKAATVRNRITDLESREKLLLLT